MMDRWAECCLCSLPYFVDELSFLFVFISLPHQIRRMAVPNDSSFESLESSVKALLSLSESSSKSVVLKCGPAILDNSTFDLLKEDVMSSDAPLLRITVDVVRCLATSC